MKKLPNFHTPLLIRKAVQKRYKAAITFLIFVLAFGCTTKKSDQLFLLNPVILEKKGAEIFQYWEFENDPALWSFDYDDATEIKHYEDTLRMVLGEQKLKDAIQKEASQNYFTKPTTRTENGDQRNSALVHSGQAGKIREINFLEAQLLNYQLSCYPLFSHPTEFQSFILFHDSLNLVRVYFASSDQPWPPKPAIIIEELKKDLNKGWKFKYHLHNHYEPKTNNYIGIMAPSLSDAQFFKMLKDNYQLKNALITNGFNTVEIKSDEFDQFESH